MTLVAAGSAPTKAGTLELVAVHGISPTVITVVGLLFPAEALDASSSSPAAFDDDPRFAAAGLCRCSVWDEDPCSIGASAAVSASTAATASAASTVSTAASAATAGTSPAVASRMRWARHGE